MYTLTLENVNMLKLTTSQAEEYGLVGSTEFGEDHAEWLSDNAVAYLNLDSGNKSSQNCTARAKTR